MRYANSTWRKFPFKRDLLPSPAKYFKSQGIKLIGGGEWKKTRCHFHPDTKPELHLYLISAAIAAWSVVRRRAQELIGSCTN